MKLRIIVVFLMSGSLNSALVAAACNDRITLTKPDSLYINNNDGTVSDKSTGLMWQQCSLGLTGNLCNIGVVIEHTWQAALAAANSNIEYDYGDWRLPNKNELVSLLEDACYGPTINETLFPNTMSGYYWSSSPLTAESNNAWFVHFNSGIVDFNRKFDVRYVRLVRGSN